MEATQSTYQFATILEDFFLTTMILLLSNLQLGEWRAVTELGMKTQ
jgi:hypothetical protein